MAYSLRILSVKSQADVERELAAIDLDPFSIRNISPKMLHRLLLIERIGAREGNVLKQELLALGGDAALAGKGSKREPAAVSVILTGTEKQLRRLCANLSQQAFGLPSLASDILRLLEGEAEPSRSWKLLSRTIDFSRRPCIMGILNITPDSFYDGNRYSLMEKAVDRAFEMQEQGADIIDIGGESTRPNAPPIDQEEELRRLMPVLERLAGKITVPLSVDTFKSGVAREVLATGVEIINDISGLTFDDRLAEVVAAFGAGLVVMHTRGRPADMQKNTEYPALISEVTSHLRKSLHVAEVSGIEAARIVVDPGIGFGKNADGNLEILRRLSELSVLGRPVMIGTSRKSFIGRVLGNPERDRLFGTAATVALGLANGASIFRVHDVAEMRDVADMAMALLEAPA